MQITKDDLDRGQDRFNIYCSVCHGMTDTATASSRDAVSTSLRRELSPGASAKRAGRTFLRRDDERLGRNAELRLASLGGRSLAHRRIHSRIAVESDESAETHVRQECKIRT
jgi:hypothetical protein